MTLTLHPLLLPWSRKSRAIPLLPLWAVRPVQGLSACTRVHFTFTFYVTLCLPLVLVNIVPGSFWYVISDVIHPVAGPSGHTV